MNNKQLINIIMETVKIDNIDYNLISYNVCEFLDDLKQGEVFEYREFYIYRTSENICKAAYKDDTSNNFQI